MKKSKQTELKFNLNIFILSDPIIKLFGTNKVQTPIKLTLFTFVVYFGFTALAAHIDGTTNMGMDFKWNLDFIRESSINGRSFYQDFPHLLSSILFFPLTIYFISISAINYHKSLLKIYNNGALKISSDELKRIFDISNKLSKNKFLFILRIALSIFTGAIYLQLYLSDNYVDWWACHLNGIGGLVLSISFVWVSYVVFWGVFIALIGYYTLFLVMQKGAINKPFHPDQCGGFKPIGDIILNVYISVVFMLFCFGMVYYFGYFGLENSPLFIFCGASLLVFSPIILLFPIMVITKPIRKSRNQYLTTISDKQDIILNQIVTNLKNNEISPNLENEYRNLTDLKGLFDYCNNANIWPFNIKTTRSLIIAYGLQIIALIYNL